ncbi:calcium-binding protein [Sulfitobacter sp. HNIBRBA3233]|uniref:calcium-binding protein n=1 Tax=Sulfitobacter marinivivus TaxID=3158558 RepID=UPI0032E02582
MADFRSSPLSFGQRVESTLGPTDNLDYYRIFLEPGGIYYLDVEGDASFHVVYGVHMWEGAGRDGYFQLDSLLTGPTAHVLIEVRKTTPGEEDYAFEITEPVYVAAGPGDDWLFWQGRETFYEGGPGYDSLSFANYTGGGGVKFDFGRGSVTIGIDLPAYASFATGGEVVGGYQKNYNSGQMVWRNVESFTGTSENDHFVGSSGRPSGNVEMRGLGGRDWFEASNACEIFDGGAGWDRVSLGYVDPVVPDEHVSLLRGKGWSGTASGDTFLFIEELEGAAGDDHFTGDRNSNRLIGGAGDDTLIGNAGQDVLVGGYGTDVAVFNYDRDQYVVGPQFPFAPFSPTEVRYIGPGAGDGVDYLTGIEILRFADGDEFI